MIDERQLEQMKAMAEAAVMHAVRRTIVLDYTEESIVLVEMVLQDLHESKKKDGPTTEQISRVASVYGAYIGQVMLKCGLADLGFAWDIADNGEPCLMRAGSDDILRPLQRAFHRLVNGPEADIVYFYSWCFDAVYTEMGIVEGAPGSQFLAENGKLDAMEACRLFYEEVLYLPSDQITWDGRGHHFIDDVKANADVFYEKPELLKSVVPMTRDMKDLLTFIEQDEGLLVNDGEIHPALYRAIGEGPLTGITLFVLQNYPGALKIEGEGGEYHVTYDERLAKSIPGFYDLIGTLIYDLRAYNEIGGSFVVNFESEQNEIEMIDPVDVVMEGCEYEADKVIVVM